MLRLEHPERGGRKVRGEVDELKAEPQIWLVAAESPHCLGVCHLRDVADLDVEDALPKGADNLLAHLDDISLFDERHLDVELGEFRLPVCTEVLVAIAARDLEIAFHTRNHEQLLEQLGRLRERVPVTRLQSHRHEEVARTLGSGSGKGWCLDLDEIEVEEHVPSDLVDL